MIMILLSYQFTFAQQEVSGTVTDEEGAPLIGVNVLAQGTTIGTVTDLDGSYTLAFPDEVTELQFSYTGYATQSIAIGGRTQIDVTLQFGAALDEVVVTAIGISREKKALSYSITEVGSDEISTVRDHNPLNSLVGKVSGVNITQGTGGPGSGSRIVIRGNNSITSNNQPLIVVDGMPIDASGSNSGGSVYNSNVTGGGITDINPDDIESISVLKGPNAAALYGSRASNGVLLITTKKGTARQGIGVSINSNITFDSPMFLPEYQNEYGQGTGQNVPANITDLKSASSSWGPRMDGSSQLYYTGENRPYTAQPDNVADFFRTAPKILNTLALEGGSKDFNARFSYTNNQTQSILPNSDLQSHNFTLRTFMNLSPRISLDAKATYFTQELNNKVSQGSEGVLAYLYYMPRNVDINDLKTYQYPEESLSSVSYSALGANPYWMLYHDKNFNRRERLLSFAKLTYKFTDWLSAFVRVGTDVANVQGESITQPGHHFTPQGALSASNARNTETNADFLFMINKDFSSKLNVSVNLGGNASYRTGEGVRFTSSNFKIPTRPILANTVENDPFYTPLTEKKVNSLYGSASIAYDNFIYLDITGRNDWSSTLPESNRSYFYPSFGLSFLLDRFIDPSGSTFDLIKLRGNYAEVGNDTDPYQLETLYFVAQDGYLGRTTLSRSSVRLNDDLRPESINSLEFGLELKMLKNRLFFDLSWYNIQSTDLIYDVPVPAATGFSAFRENIGKVTNKGVEFLLGGSPVRGPNFNWELAFNFSANKNELVELIEDLNSHTLNTTNSGNVSIQATVGGGYGDIYGTTWRTNDAGQLVVNSNGVPLASSDRVLLGNAQPDWIGGLTNTFSYKNLMLRFLIDARIGGQVYSATNASLDGSGVSVASLQYRDGGVVVDGVVEQEDGTYIANTTQITAQQYWGAYSGIGSNYVYNQDNIRLREFVLGYTIPASSLSSSFLQSATISLIGRNLFFLSKDIPNVDPEASLGTSNAGMGILSNNLPTLRSLGFNISLKF
ncbi:MAG: SusC/RagA family TonB-linked outer membrane protein [Saprospiraceae bacterium]